MCKIYDKSLFINVIFAYNNGIIFGMSMYISQMEPLLPSSERPTGLDDLVIDLVAKANHLSGQLRPETQVSISELVRSMNCYYSNLIEGHNTHPREIDRALADQYSDDLEQRNLQLEARAHIEVQRLIDSGDDPDLAPTSTEYVSWIHYEFCRRLPDEMLWVENPDTGEKLKVEPGEFRTKTVQVGRHIPPEAADLRSFMRRFAEKYDANKMTQIDAIIATGAAHHRFLWIHPFLDGNGRVARLMSHASLLRCGIGGNLWSVARGLARTETQYKSLLQRADLVRQGDFDGRGALSEKALVEFCNYFLSMSINQITFMESLLQPGEILRRMKLYCDDEVAAGRLPKRSMAMLREAFLLGEFERRNAPAITGYQERKAREILAELLKRGLLVSTGPRKPVRLGFPLDVVERWFPALYPVG